MAAESLHREQALNPRLSASRKLMGDQLLQRGVSTVAGARPLLLLWFLQRHWTFRLTATHGR